MDKVEPKLPGFDLYRDELHGTITHLHGWPFVAHETIFVTGSERWPPIHGNQIWTLKPTALWLDALTALGLLSGIGVMAESLIRRHGGRKA